MAITWQNVAAPDLTDVSRMLNQGAGQTANAFKSLAEAFDPIKQAAATRRAADKQINTLREIDAINAINNVNDVRNIVPTITADSLAGRYGGQDNIDIGQVLAHAAKAENNLTNLLNNREAYDTALQTKEEQTRYDSIFENVKRLRTTKDLDANREFFNNQLQDLTKLGKKGIEEFNSYYKSLQDTEKAALDDQENKKLRALSLKNQIMQANNLEMDDKFRQLSSSVLPLVSEQISKGMPREVIEQRVSAVFREDPAFKLLRADQQNALMQSVYAAADPTKSSLVTNSAKEEIDINNQTIDQAIASARAQAEIDYKRKELPQVTNEELNAVVKNDWLDADKSLNLETAASAIYKEAGLKPDSSDMEEITTDLKSIFATVEKDLGRKLTNPEKIRFVKEYKPSDDGVFNADLGFKNSINAASTSEAEEYLKTMLMQLEILKNNENINIEQKKEINTKANEVIKSFEKGKIQNTQSGLYR